MKTPPQKIIVIYHGDCPDGFGGAYAAWKKFGARAAYLPAMDRFALPCPLKNKEVYLIDYTYQEDLIKKLLSDNKRVTAIDHHITAECAAKLTQNYSFALDHSGAVLAWNYFHPGKKVPMMLRYVEDRDLWRWKLPASKAVLAYFDLAARSFVAWDKAVKEFEQTKQRKMYKEKGELLLRYEKILLDETLPSAELVRFAGHTVFAVNAPHRLTSEIGNILAKKTNSFAIVWREMTGTVKVSLRSASAVDVAKIAKKFGGGGHKRAAAFSFSVRANGIVFPWKVVKHTLPRDEK
jgi:oligoribonuclease NrnB/cAMP/cGMP phosphodiesterase (DHH superfamily)